MKLLGGIFFASTYGLTIRLLFGFLGDLTGLMGLAFLCLAPFLIGVVTIGLLSHKTVKSYTAAFFYPWLSCLAVLIITIAFSIEGAICWIIIFPFFAIMAGLGGVLSYKIFHKAKNDDDFNEDDLLKPNTLNVSFFMFVPLLIGVIEGDRTLTPKNMALKKEIIINANSKKVWAQLININEIKQHKSNWSITQLIGFPKHLKTTLDTAKIGGKRMAYYEKGLYFDETITQIEDAKLLVLKIKTDPYNIPPTVMDEHILIGGKHLDILEDTYTLEDLPNNQCKLTLTSKFWINTAMNWYASIWSNILMSDILNEELQLIAERAE